MHTQCKAPIAGKVIIRDIVALVLLPLPRWLQTTYDAIHEMGMVAEESSANILEVYYGTFFKDTFNFCRISEYPYWVVDG